MSVSDQQLVQRWQSATNELRHYKEKAANSAPSVLETMISKDLNEMDVGNCRAVLDQVELPAAGNIFAERAQTLVSLASDRCGVLRGQAGAAYQNWRPSSINTWPTASPSPPSCRRRTPRRNGWRNSCA